MLKPSVEIHNENGIMVAEFWDCLRLDPAPVQELRGKYESHIRAGGRPEVAVDLSGVGFAGSAALGNFVALHRLARQKGGRIVFCNVEPTVVEVFRASKLEPLFEFVADRAAAIKAIERGPIAPASPGGADGPEGLAARRTPATGPAGLSRLRRKRSDPDSA